MSSSEYGNCAILGATIILPSNSGSELIDDSNLNDQDYNLNDANICQQTDHDYISTMWQLNNYVEDISVYIGGFVVQKLIKKINCSVCCSCLQSNNTSNLLIITKNRGSLIKPSKNVKLLCIETEKSIRQNQTIIFQQKNIHELLKNLVKRRVFSVVFKNKAIDDRILNQILFNYHRPQLINYIITFYIKIRLYHEGRELNKVVTYT